MRAARARRLAALVAHPLALLGLLACGEASDPGGGDDVARVVVEAVDLDQSGAVVVQDSVQLAATLLDAADQVLPARTTIWHSSDPSVGTVSATGLLSGLKAGRVTITAEAGRKIGSYVTDVLALPDTLEIVPAHLGLVAGGVYDLSVIFRDSDGAELEPTGRRVVWETGSPEFVAVTGGINARVTGVSRGSATLFATASGKTSYVGVGIETPHFYSLVAGIRQSCAYDSFEMAYCWGSNQQHALGAPIGGASVAPLLVEGLDFKRMRAVVPGNGHVCGLTVDGEAWCWGAGSQGQLGDGSSGPSAEAITPPRQTAGGLEFQTLAAGDGFTCGLTTAGAAYCWGDGSEGTLGNGLHVDATTPTPVSGVLTFSELATHPLGRTVCGVAGSVHCWGRNRNGQVGDGTIDERTVPTGVASAVFLHGIAVGTRHACALDPAGAAYCWGGNDLGRLGQSGVHFDPSPVDTDLEFTILTAGTAYTCGVALSGEAYCWGDNAQGQLGDGTTTPSASPVPVSGGLSFYWLSAGNDHTCGLTTIGVAYCWGSGEAVGSPVDGMTTVPVQVQGQTWAP
jgi:alpha-tubulin suppressor-like RCC1 family protein